MSSYLEKIISLHEWFPMSSLTIGIDPHSVLYMTQKDYVIRTSLSEDKEYLEKKSFKEDRSKGLVVIKFHTEDKHRLYRKFGTSLEDAAKEIIDALVKDGVILREHYPEIMEIENV